jgi:hypothetical protein
MVLPSRYAPGPAGRLVLLGLLKRQLPNFPTRQFWRYPTDVNEKRSGDPRPGSFRYITQPTAKHFGISAVFRPVPPRASLPQEIQQVQGLV